MGGLYEAIVRLREIEELAKTINKWTMRKELARVFAFREYWYFYGHRKIDRYDVFVIDPADVEVVDEWLMWYINRATSELYMPPTTRALLRVLLRMARPAKEVDRIVLHEHFDNAREDYDKYVAVYEIPAGAVPIVVHVYTPYRNKYSTFLGPRETIFVPEPDENEIYLGVSKSDIERALEIRLAGELMGKLPASVVKQIIELKKRGYEIETAEKRVTLTIGSSSTSIAHWKAEYDVIYGDVERTVIDEESNEFGWKRVIEVRPTTEIAVIKYTASGYPFGYWNRKKVIILTA